MGLEDLVAHPLIWRGQANPAVCTALPTGFPALDEYLPGGGWPRKAITEIFLDHYGIGELSLLMPALASLSEQASRAKRWIVWIAPPFVPYAPALLGRGIDLRHMLCVDPSSADLHWAVEQVLRSGSSLAVFAWLKDTNPTATRRFQLAAEEHDCWAVFFRPAATLQQSSPAALRLKLSRIGAHARIEIVKCRGKRPSTLDLSLIGAQP